LVAAHVIARPHPLLENLIPQGDKKVVRSYSE